MSFSDFLLFLAFFLKLENEILFLFEKLFIAIKMLQEILIL